MLEVVAGSITDPVAVTLLPASARIMLRGRAPVRRAAGTAIGVELPDVAGASATVGARAALWLGPDEWLLLTQEDDRPALLEALGDALREVPHALVDVSDRQVALEIAGAGAETVLAAGCPLDLDVRHFPAGRCSRTLFGKAEVVIWRTGSDRFRVEVGRSFAAYVTAFLELARTDWTGAS